MILKSCEKLALKFNNWFINFLDRKDNIDHFLNLGKVPFKLAFCFSS